PRVAKDVDPGAAAEQQDPLLRHLVHEARPAPRGRARVRDLRPQVAVPGPGVGQRRTARVAPEQDHPLPGGVVGERMARSVAWTDVLLLGPEARRHVHPSPRDALAAIVAMSASGSAV